MIYKANQLTRQQQSKLSKPTRGFYVDGSYDYFDIYLQKYSSAVVTLTTALSIHGLIDYWVEFPFDLDFKIGYRKISDDKINQYRDTKKILYLGIELQKRNKITFKIYNKERLLIELWRKEKYLQKEIYKQAIYNYRNLVNSNELNIPLLKSYINKIPKSKIYLKRLSTEIL